MLTSFRKGGIALATATLCFATAAQAANHNVTIVDGGYFPEIIYVEEGDNIIFINASDFSHTVVSSTGEWTTGELLVDAKYKLKVTGVTDLSFAGFDGAGELVVGPEGEAVVGKLTFEAPPIIDGENN